MTDGTTNAAGQSAGVQQRQVQIHKVYLKDVSFESPAAPGIFTAGQVQPQAELQLNTESSRVHEGMYEVILAITVTGKTDERTVFLVEIKQAGLFAVQGFDQNEIEPILGAYCPSMLFPFAREAVADLVQKGGLPQLMLQPVNFDALYAQHLRQQQQGASASEAT